MCSVPSLDIEGYLEKQCHRDLGMVWLSGRKSLWMHQCTVWQTTSEDWACTRGAENTSLISLHFPLLTEHNSKHLSRLSLLLLWQPPSHPFLGDAPFLFACTALPPSLTAPHAILKGGRTRCQSRSCHGWGENRSRSNRDGQGDPGSSRFRRGLRRRRRSQTLLILWQEMTWLHFKRVNHCLFNQALCENCIKMTIKRESVWTECWLKLWPSPLSCAVGLQRQVSGSGCTASHLLVVYTYSEMEECHVYWKEKIMQKRTGNWYLTVKFICW